MSSHSPGSIATKKSISCAAVLIPLLSACGSSYPHREARSDGIFPLPECKKEILDIAAAQAANPNEPRVSKHSLCVTPLMPRLAKQETDEEKKKREYEEADGPYELALRTKLEKPFNKGGQPQFGIALSGGGTKASSFSMGVLAGLAGNQLLDRADYVSTVSGGGYAAYFYYTHRLFPLLRGGGRSTPTSAQLFEDCVDMPPRSTLITDDVRAQIALVSHCDRLGLLPNVPQTQAQNNGAVKYQAFVKCTQDVLRPGRCSTETTNWKRRGVSIPSALGTLATAIPSWVPNLIFDWGYTTSPSAVTYRDGIGLGYGATIKDPSILARGRGKGMTYCGDNADDAFDCITHNTDPHPDPMTFAELKAGLLKMNSTPETRMPFWIINAAAPQYRTSYGMLVRTKEDATNSDMFEMTPVSHGSGRYGYVSAPVSIYDMSVLHAVAASAAFFDSSQIKITNPVGKTVATLLQQTFNFNWGYDIPNYNVSTTRRYIHRSLPLGLYYFDGYVASRFAPNRDMPGAGERNKPSFIRIIDGGNAENLGVYSLIKRGTRNILISDAAQDTDGTFGDICGLKKRLKAPPDAEKQRHLYVPGLAGFDEHCKIKKPDQGYSIHLWRSAHPVLMGCVRTKAAADPDQEACQNLGPDETRLFIVKPAINLQAFTDNQVDRNGYHTRVKACHTRANGAVNSANMLNCDSSQFLVANIKAETTLMRANDVCPIFPQHKTARMTANSSATLFVAYRELARQYIDGAALMIRDVVEGEPEGIAQYEKIAGLQYDERMTRNRGKCPSLKPLL